MWGQHATAVALRRPRVRSFARKLADGATTTVHVAAHPARTTRVSGLGVTLALTYDVTTSRLQYTPAIDARQRPRVAAIWLHSGTPEKPGAARHALFDARAADPPNLPRTVTLSSGVRDDLEQGRLLVRFYPTGDGESVTVHLPEMRAWQ